MTKVLGEGRQSERRVSLSLLLESHDRARGNEETH